MEEIKNVSENNDDSVASSSDYSSDESNKSEEDEFDEPQNWKSGYEVNDQAFIDCCENLFTPNKDIEIP